MTNSIILNILSSISIPKNKEFELLPLKKKFLYVPASVKLEIHPGIQKPIIPGDMESIKLELCLYIPNSLFLASSFNAFATKLSSYIQSNNIEAKKFVELNLSFCTYSILAVVKKVGQSSIKQKSNFHHFIVYLYRILHGQLQ